MYVDDDVARTNRFNGVCKGNVLSDDGGVDYIDLLRVLIGQPFLNILQFLTGMHLYGYVALVRRTHCRVFDLLGNQIVITFKLIDMAVESKLPNRDVMDHRHINNMHYSA